MNVSALLPHNDFSLFDDEYFADYPYMQVNKGSSLA